MDDSTKPAVPPASKCCSGDTFFFFVAVVDVDAVVSFVTEALALLEESVAGLLSTASLGDDDDAGGVAAVAAVSALLFRLKGHIVRVLCYCIGDGKALDFGWS